MQCPIHLISTMQSGKCLLAQWEAYIGPGWHALTYIGPVQCSGKLTFTLEQAVSHVLPISPSLPHSPPFSSILPPVPAVEETWIGFNIARVPTHFFHPDLMSTSKKSGKNGELTWVDSGWPELIQLDLPKLGRDGNNLELTLVYASWLAISINITLESAPTRTWCRPPTLLYRKGIGSYGRHAIGKSVQFTWVDLNELTCVVLSWFELTRNLYPYQQYRKGRMGELHLWYWPTCQR